MKKTVILILAVSGFCLNSRAQFTNNGAEIFIPGQATVSIQTDYVHNAGSLLHEGWLQVAGNWKNFSNTHVFDGNSTGVVALAGRNQYVEGPIATRFPSLYLTGAGTKSLLGNIQIMKDLQLFDSRLHVGSHTVDIWNGSSSALGTSTGIITTLVGGGVRWLMLEKKPYRFPMGYQLPGGAYVPRPLEITHKEEMSIFTVALLTPSAGFSGVDLRKKFEGIGHVNDRYFMRITRHKGERPVDLATSYNRQTEGVFNTILQWRSALQMLQPLPAIPTPDYNPAMATDAALKVVDQSDFRDDLFAIGSWSSQALADKIPKAFSPNGDGINDFWDLTVLGAYPQATVDIFSREGRLLERLEGGKGMRWSGRHKGALMPLGVYYFIADLHDGSPRIKGHVTLVR